MTIDWWTLAIQAVNVIILVWLLQHFFWRPIAAMIEQRRSTVQKTLADAKTAQDKAAAALADVAQTRAGFAKERDDILAAAHADAEHARATALDDAAKELAARTAAATAALAKERADTEAAWSDRAARLSLEIAGRLAARLQGPAVNAAFLDWLLTSIRTLPDTAKHAAGLDGAVVEAVSAGPLSPAEQDHAKGQIGEAFGSHPTITFKTDPALIAGLELHGPEFSVSNSWRADLAKVGTDLSHAT